MPAKFLFNEFRDLAINDDLDKMQSCICNIENDDLNISSILPLCAYSGSNRVLTYIISYLKNKEVDLDHDLLTSALRWACSENKKVAAHLLLDNFEFDISDMISPLAIAVIKNHIKIVYLLVEHQGTFKDVSKYTHH